MISSGLYNAIKGVVFFLNVLASAKSLSSINFSTYHPSSNCLIMVLNYDDLASKNSNYLGLKNDLICKCMCTYNLSSLHDPKSFGDIKRSHLIKKISRGLPNVICGTLNGIYYQSFNLARLAIQGAFVMCM